MLREVEPSGTFCATGVEPLETNGEDLGTCPNDNDLIERYLYAITRHLPSAHSALTWLEAAHAYLDMLDERAAAACRPRLGRPGRAHRARTLVRWCASTRAGKGMPDRTAVLRTGTFTFLKIGAWPARRRRHAGRRALSLATGVRKGASLGGVLKGIGSLIGALLRSRSSPCCSPSSPAGASRSRRWGSLDDLPPVPRETRSPRAATRLPRHRVLSIVGAVVFLLFPDVR